MKLTARQLRQIIKEEVQTAVRRRILKEEFGPYGRALNALDALDALMKAKPTSAALADAAGALAEYISDLPNAEELSTKPLVDLKTALLLGAEKDNP